MVLNPILSSLSLLIGEEDIVRLLLHYGADPSLSDAGGGRPIDVACFLRNKGKAESVKLLLRDGHVGYLLKKMRQILQWQVSRAATPYYC